MSPTRERTARVIFRVGRKVEVSFEEENLRHVWFPATVLEDLGNDSFLVEYQCAVINNEAELHKVTVDHLHIRPSAPRLRDKNFVLLEKIDAFYDFGWHSGVITKELADNRYVVFFKLTNEEREFSHLELRSHVEWKDGQWFSPYQDPVCNDVYSAENGVVHGETSSVKCSIEERETVNLNLTEPIEETSVVTLSMKRTKPTSPDSNNRHSKPSKKSKAAISSDDAKVGQTKERGKRSEGVELNSPTMNSTKKKGKITFVIKSPGPETLPQVDSAKKETPKMVEKENATKDLPLPVVIGLQCNAIKVSQGKKLQPLPSQKPSNIAQRETQQSGVQLTPKPTLEPEEKEGDGETVMKRKRGRPPKLQAKSPEASMAANHHNGDVGPGAVTVKGSQKNTVSPIGAETEPEKDQLKPTVNNKTGPKQKSASKTVDAAQVSVDKLPNESSGKTLTILPAKSKSVKGKRGKLRTISSLNIESSNQDCQEKAGNSGLPVEKSIDTMSDDQPLSRWFEGMQSSTTVNGSDHSSEASKKQSENIKSPVSVANGQNLPFVKATPLWQTIEAMEVFRMIPQKPHFRPLDGIKESAREGQAISCMVNFARVAEKTSELRFDYPKSVIEDYLETLVELESHGFDVKLIRNRLSGLLVVKEKHEELEAKAKEVREKIEEQSVEEGMIEKEIEELDKKIKELQERRVEVVLKKEKKGFEIAGLEAVVDGIKQRLSEARVKFDGLAAASW